MPSPGPASDVDRPKELSSQHREFAAPDDDTLRSRLDVNLAPGEAVVVGAL